MRLLLSPKALFLITGLLAILLASCAGPRPHQGGRYEHLRPKLVAAAMAMEGTPYRYGGNSPAGFDCSGLVQYSYAQFGFEVPRNSYMQFRAAKPIYRRDLRPGDLVFFRTTSATVSHVGIYIGNNQFVHAPGTGKRVRVTSLDNSYYQKRYAGAGRYL